MAATMPVTVVAWRCSDMVELIDDEVSGDGKTTSALRVAMRTYICYRLNW